MGGEGALPHGARLRPPRRPRPAPRLRQQPRAGLSWPPGMTTICQLGPSVMSPTAEPAQLLVRRDQRTHDRATPKRVARSSRAESRGRCVSTDAVRMSQWPSDQRYVIPVAPGPDVVTVTIDGKEVQAPRGELLIKVAQEHGTYIPRFCWHERMKPVGMCRMCLVEVEGMRGLQISCATPVTDGMVVNTQSPNVKAVQDGVLEFLLINHPLDCPVCDRGGECPLQDQTLAFGPGESRFVEEKRHFEKPIPISDLVLLDRERCIQCGRCTRFAGEIAGDPLIDFGERGADTEVITYPDEPFSSYFSGNTVQICPVGALTAKPYRFRARPWDLQTVETSCTTCAVGCRGALQSHVEPARAPARRRLRAGEPGLALRQGSLRLRVGALARIACARRWCASTASWSRCRGRRRSTPRPTGCSDALDADGPGAIARARRRARHERGRLRVGALRQGRARHRQRRRPARRRPPGRGRARAARARPSPTSTAPAAIVARRPRPQARSSRSCTCACGAPRSSSACPSIELAPRATGLTRDVTAVLRHAPGEAGRDGRAVRPGRRHRRHRLGQRLDREGGQRRSTVATATSW